MCEQKIKRERGLTIKSKIFEDDLYWTGVLNRLGNIS